MEVGCGNGLATRVLVEHSQATITAVDNEQPALDRLMVRLETLGLNHRVQTECASMTSLPFKPESFDLIWAEGSAYIMGVEKALRAWKPLLKQNGFMMLSDLVWQTDSPGDEAKALWQEDYPDMQLVATRVKQMERAGYRVVEHFPMSDQGRLNYYEPLAKRVDELSDEMADSAALKAIKREVDICTRYADEFGYHLFILCHAQ